MHELAVTESILNIASKHGIQANALKVTDIYIVIGQLSSIVDDSVQFYWDIISESTICEGAKLHFNRIPAELLCLECNHQYPIDREMTACPKCNSKKVKVARGDEFLLDSIEISKD